MSTKKKMIHAIEFLIRYPSKWHSYNPNYETTSTVCCLVNLGIAKVNQFDQFKLKSISHANQYLNAH